MYYELAHDGDTVKALGTLAGWRACDWAMRGVDDFACIPEVPDDLG
jgi:hypothetical protein